MNKVVIIKGGKRKILALAMVTAAVLAISLLRPSGPSYRGKSLSRWFYRPTEGDAEAFPTYESNACFVRVAL